MLTVPSFSPVAGVTEPTVGNPSNPAMPAHEVPPIIPNCPPT